MIYRQEGYVLKEIEGSYVLLPVGQSIADQKKAVTLNEAGVFVWEILKNGKSMEEVLDEVIRHYQADETEEEEVRKDVAEFIDQMLSAGILREELKRIGEPYYGCMRIAKLFVKLYGKPVFFSECFTPFLVQSPGEADMDIELVNAVPGSRQNGKILLQNQEMTICEWEEGYVVRFHMMENIVEAYITQEGKYARIHCFLMEGSLKERDNLFHAIRLLFLYRAQKSGYTAIHSASVLYRQKAWLFSGHSGCGKSTHTALWNEKLGTPYLNGDLNLVGRCKDGTWKVYGIPWCGTSGIYTTQTFELGGIVLLKQAKQDCIKSMSPYEKVLRIMQRMISPAWTDELLSRNLSCAKELAKDIPVYHLLCTKNPSAVDTIQAQIDNPEV